MVLLVKSEIGIRAEKEHAQKNKKVAYPLFCENAINTVKKRKKWDSSWLFLETIIIAMH